MADAGSQGGENKRGFGSSDRSWNGENSGGSNVDPQDLGAKRARVSGSEDGVQETEGGENLGGSGEGVEERALGSEPMVVDEDLQENREELPGPVQAEVEDEMLESSLTPLSKAVETIIERKLAAEKNSRPLIVWLPLAQKNDIPRRLVTSLEDDCVDILAKNTDAIVSLESVPDALRHKISRASCRGRTMNAHFVELLLKGSPSEIRVDDCSWMTEEQFTNLFNGCDTSKLTVSDSYFLCGCLLKFFIMMVIPAFRCECLMHLFD